MIKSNLFKNSVLTFVTLSTFLLSAHSAKAIEAPQGMSPFEMDSILEEEILIDSREAAVGKKPSRQSRDTKAINNQVSATLKKAKSLAASGQYEEASRLFFSMTRSPYFRDRQTELKYSLGLMLFEMKLYQLAGFLFFDVIQSEAKSSSKSRYLRLALEKLSLTTNFLESEVLLKFAVGKVSQDDFPVNQKDLFYYRLGNIKLDEKNFEEASRVFSRIPAESSFYAPAKYRQGLAYAESGQLDRALGAFDDLEKVSSNRVTDMNRVNAVAGKARVYYQKKDFEKATEYYREIPRDTYQWHDSLFERSWAMLRSGQFRSALSNFHTLHSTYYKDFYLPESLLLRGIVYLYICRWDEMDKTLDLFDRIYKPIHKKIYETLNAEQSSEYYYSEMRKVHNFLKSSKKSEVDVYPETKIPYMLLRQVYREGNIQKNLKYLNRLEAERAIVARLSSSWQKAAIGQYAKRMLSRRISNTKAEIGRLTVSGLRDIRGDLRRLVEEADFLRLEQVTGQKEAVKKTMSGKNLPTQRVDDDAKRDYYVQNGYEYWPFQGEYWLDELGNYHYVGVQNCQK